MKRHRPIKANVIVLEDLNGPMRSAGLNDFRPKRSIEEAIALASKFNSLVDEEFAEVEGMRAFVALEVSELQRLMESAGKLTLANVDAA